MNLAHVEIFVMYFIKPKNYNTLNYISQLYFIKCITHGISGYMYSRYTIENLKCFLPSALII